MTPEQKAVIDAAAAWAETGERFNALCHDPDARMSDGTDAAWIVHTQAADALIAAVERMQEAPTPASNPTARLAHTARAFLTAWRRGDDETCAVDEANDLEAALDEWEARP